MRSSLSELNSIDFVSLRLTGREVASERLKAAFEDAISNTEQEPSNKKVLEKGAERCILIAGKSGSGKTTLVDSLYLKVKRFGGTILSGKFDQLPSTLPYSAVVDAIGTLCQRLKEIDENAKAEIVRILGNDISLFYTLVPSARVWLQSVAVNSDQNSISPEHDISHSWRFLRLKLMIRKLFQAVSKLGPVVLFLDDLQWCDTGSIDMINSLLSDQELTNFFFIGAYRDDEITQGHELSKLIGFGNESRRIQVQPLCEDDVNRLIATALNLEETATLPLAKVIYRKTAGNCFFVIHLLKLLEIKDILIYSRLDYRWTWDMARISSEIESSDNVADFVASKLRTLPFESQSALAIASCFGNKFDGAVLDAVLKTVQSEAKYRCVSSRELQKLLSLDAFTLDVDQLLGDAVKGGFLDRLQTSDMTVHKFSHDKIQSAAYELVKPSDKLRLHSLIGKILQTMLPDANASQHDTLLLNIVEQFHRAGRYLLVEDEAFRVQVAQLNLEAARSVQRNAAFVTAANYLRSSVALLKGEECWSTNYHLTLETMNLKAKMELCCRRHNDSKETVLEILAKTSCVEDKIQAYVVWVDCLGSERKNDEILETVYAVAAHIGF